MNPAQAYTIMFFTGGFLYCALEILMRGYSHISMLLAGGICFVLVGAVQNLLGGQASLVGQMLLCSLMITVVEFVVGMIVNRYLHLADSSTTFGGRSVFYIVIYGSGCRVLLSYSMI